MSAAAVTIRPATADDRDAIIALARDALGWAGDDRDRRFFAWKHDENPFGPSPAWVAEAGGRLAGFRTFLRWEFETPDGRIVRAVRAVDTATHPDFQGQGLFTRLTLEAIDALTAEGVGLVFNTPNANSRPGYLKMGWHVVGRPPLLVRPRSVGALARLLAARAPAAKWSVPVAGDAAADVLTEAFLARLLGRLAAPRGFRTPRTPAFLAWRYRFPELAYRAVAGDDGAAIYRVRERGKAREVTITDMLVPGGDRRAEAALLRRVAAVAPGDFLLRIGSARRRRGLEAPLPRQGPILTARSLGEPVPPLAGWDVTLGDLELF
jgi:GNAT superfamily N-acetyltransferase